MLLWLILIPLLAGPLAWLSERRGAHWPRFISIGALSLDLALTLGMWSRYQNPQPSRLNPGSVR
jgi:NADH:ubiquinone oxidoreductase subunit 4 (chain M)